MKNYYEAKVCITNGEVNEVLLGLTNTARRKGEKLNISRDAILHALKIASVELQRLPEDSVVAIEKGQGRGIDFTRSLTLNNSTVTLNDFQYEESKGEDLQQVLSYFIRQGRLTEVKKALEARLNVQFTEAEWQRAKNELLLNSKGDIGKFLKEMTVPKEKFYILVSVLKKSNTSTYVDVITVANNYFADSTDSVIRLSNIA